MKPVPENERCQGYVWIGFESAECSYRASIERNGKRYCHIHDPVRIKARRDAASARYQAQTDARIAVDTRHNLEHAACLGIPDDVLASGLIGRLYREHLARQEQGKIS